MKLLFKTLLSFTSFGFTQLGYANIVGQDIIQESCSKNYNRYYSCNFNHFTTEYLTNTRTFTLFMDFTVSYSRGFCPNKFENRRYYSDYFYLYLSSGMNNKAILAGNNRTKLKGHSLVIKDLNPTASYATELYAPCKLIIRKVELDFSADAKQELNEIQQSMNESMSTFSIYKTLKENTSNLITTLNQLDLNRAKINLNEFINNLKQLEETNHSDIEEIFSPQQMALLNNCNKKLINLSSQSNNEMFNNIAKSIKKTIEDINKNIQNKEISNKADFSQSQNDYLLLQKVFHEVEYEPNFNQTSLQSLKKIIGN